MSLDFERTADVGNVIPNMEQAITEESHVHLGSGSCKVCDCKQFVPSSTGRQCIGSNSEGGTCNHWYDEHN